MKKLLPTILWTLASLLVYRMEGIMEPGSGGLFESRLIGNPLGFLKQKPKIYRKDIYPGLAFGGGELTLYEANRTMIDQVCGGSGEMDDGTNINHANRENVWGCNLLGEGEIYYLYGKACIIPHELCHEAGLPNEVCDTQYHTDNYCK